MFKKKQFFKLLLLLPISLITGCYTVVMHQKNVSLPVAETAVNDPGYSPSVSLYEPNSCTSCHDGDMSNSRMDAAHPVFGQTSLWVYYYDTDIPWWISRGQSQESTEEDTEELGDTGSRRYYGRRREALNNDNASSSITPTSGTSSDGGAFIPSFPASIPSGGGTITTTLTADSSKAQVVDSSQAKQETGKAEPLNKKRDFGVRKNVKKK